MFFLNKHENLFFFINIRVQNVKIKPELQELTRILTDLQLLDLNVNLPNNRRKCIFFRNVLTFNFRIFQAKPFPDN